MLIAPYLSLDANSAWALEETGGSKTMCIDGNINVATNKRKKTRHCVLAYCVLDTIMHFLYSSYIINLSQLSCKVGFIYQYSTNKKTGGQKG